jgi:hypothetical protein
MSANMSNSGVYAGLDILVSKSLPVLSASREGFEEAPSGTENNQKMTESFVLPPVTDGLLEGEGLVRSCLTRWCVCVPAHVAKAVKDDLRARGCDEKCASNFSSYFYFPHFSS